MKIGNVSFGSLYVLPNSYSGYDDLRRDFIASAKTMIKPEEKETVRYNIGRDAYYVNIKDKFDKTFENCVTMYGLYGVKLGGEPKIPPTLDTLRVSVEKTPAQQDTDAMIKLISSGVNHEITDNGNGTKSVTLFSPKLGIDKTLYVFEMNAKQKLMKKIEFVNTIDGTRPDVTYYDKFGAIENVF